jgi:superfamily II DNA or RNA helicase
MDVNELKPGIIVRGPALPEPVEVLVIRRLGEMIKLDGRGKHTGQAHQRVLHPEQLALLVATPEDEAFTGDPKRFALGVEAARLALAYEYDPYFSLSIARVDPLPHQLEAVYDYFIKLPRIRFLLADDPGAGKTVMAGLLLKELKIRGLAKRTLIVTPANLTFQWAREMKDKFRENFDVIRSEQLRSSYGQNPWQERSQVITSVSWVSRIEDAKDSLLRSHWDLVIVDEAHKMSAHSADKKTLAYKLGESLSTMTDHYLLMTATPHKGDAENFCLFLQLLDRDIYGNVKSLEEAMKRNHAPFYLRRTKEALVTFPHPETGEVKKLFTKREVRTVAFDLDHEEFEFYDALTRFVEDQSIRAMEDDSARGRALAFTMAMLQRRFASSVYAVRRSLERMRDKRQKILADPQKYRQEQIEAKLPDDFEELPEDERTAIEADLEELVATVDPAALREEIQKLDVLIQKARVLEASEHESKLDKLKKVLSEQHIFDDPKMKLLIFTEHKDTLDYLAGDGRDGRPLGKLRTWGLKTTQIHGGMKIGDRDTPNTRIYAEREFREDAQILVATEAAGEGINLQFCWFMINYDIPWNPVRLEQRIGRIHRYGQEKDCLVFNFVAKSTREGRVLAKLHERLQEIRNDLGTDQVFDVVGDVFPAATLEKLFREMYAQRMNVHEIEARIVKDVDAKRFRQITHSTLEGLAKRELNLSAIVGKSAEAKERRLVPEVIRDFFVTAAPLASVHPKAVQKDSPIYRIGKLPRTLAPIGEKLEPRFGRLGKEYQRITFDKATLQEDPTLEWVTPGHPLFEAVRADVTDRVQEDLRRGAVFYDLNINAPARLDVFGASIKDGRNNTVSRRLFVLQTDHDGAMTIRQPTYFLDLAPADPGTKQPNDGLSSLERVEDALIEKALVPFLHEVSAGRSKEVETVARHVEISLNELINRAQLSVADLEGRRIQGENIPGLEGNISQAETHLDALANRLDTRRAELAMERQLAIGDIVLEGSAWVLPHPQRTSPGIAAMVRDEEIEAIAIAEVIKRLTSEGWIVEDVQKENKGFDLIARKQHPHDDKTFIDVRFVEVKGRAAIGEVALSANEYHTAERLKNDYWLYVAFNCALQPEVHIVQNPARLGWRAVMAVAHYHLGHQAILQGETR